MAALVPYARWMVGNPYRTPRMYLNYLRKRRAARVIGGAYRTYRAARASGIYRGVKRLARSGLLQRRKRQRIGERVGKGTTKRNETQNINGINHDSNTLYWYDLLSLGRTSTNEIMLRQRDIANIRGFKLCMEITNQASKPLYVNIAVVANAGDRGTVGQQTWHEDDFFRSHGNERAVDFKDVNLGCLDRHCRPMNSDKYIILTHKRYRLGPNTFGAGYADADRSYMNFNRYIPLKRQVRWSDGSADTAPENAQIFLYIWYGEYNKTSNVIGTAVANNTMRSVIYWREPK